MFKKISLFSVWALFFSLIFGGTPALALDGVPPEVVLTSPVDTATNVPVSSDIAVTFTEAMDASTIIANSSFIVTEGGVGVAGTVNYSPATFTATFNPTANLSYNTLVEVMLTPDIADVSGETLYGMSGYAFSFTTAPQPGGDTTPPVIVGSDPAPNTVNAVLDGIVGIFFNEAISPASVTNSTFYITGPGGNLAGNYDVVGSNITFISGAALLPATTYTVNLTTGIQDIAGNNLVSPYSYTFMTDNNAPPAVVSTSPLNGATGVNVVSNIVINVNEPVYLGLNSVVVTDSSNAVVAGVITGDLTSTLTFNPNSNLAYSTVYNVAVTNLEDSQGNFSSPYNFSFTTQAPPDLTPPTVTSTVPVNNAIGVAVDSNITVNFSESIANNTGTITVTSGGNPIARVLQYTGSQLTINPNSNLPFASVINVSISGVQDLANNPLANPYNFSFTTADVPDTNPPIVTLTNPTNNQTGVGVGSNIVITFDENVQNPIMDVSGITGVATANGNQVTFVPDANLEYSTQYTVAIQAEDLQGNQMLLPYSFSFTTEAAADTTAPSVSSVDPSDGQNQVPIDSNIVITFSENIKDVVMTVSYNPNVLGQTNVNGNVVTFNPNNNLLYSTLYHVSIQASDMTGNPLAQTYQSSFTTMDDPNACELSAPELVSPQNGVENVEKEVTLKWNAVSGATGYHLVVSKNSNLSNPVFDGDLTETEKQLTLEAGTVYYWKVTALGDNECSKDSEKWSFKTKVKEDGQGGEEEEDDDEIPPIIPTSFTTPVDVSLGESEGLGGGELPEAGQESILWALAAALALTIGIRMKELDYEKQRNR